MYHLCIIALQLLHFTSDQKVIQDLERISLRSEVNSLCSEPVRLYDYNDFNEEDKNGGQFAAVSMADIFGDICGNQAHLSADLKDVSKNCTSKSTVSLCEMPTAAATAVTATNGKPDKKPAATLPAGRLPRGVVVIVPALIVVVVFFA